MSTEQWQDRVFKLMEESEFDNITALTLAAGVSNGSFTRALKGQHEIKQSTLEKIAATLGCNVRFLLYGETDLTFFSMPVMSDDHLGLWLGNQLELEQCSERLAPPMDMRPRAFAWRTNRSDMEPVFALGSLLYFDAGFDADEVDFYRPVYVLTGLGNPTKQKKLRTAETAGQLPESAYVDIVFSRLVMTGKGYQLVSVNPSFPNSMEFEERLILARLRHVLTSFN